MVNKLSTMTPITPLTNIMRELMNRGYILVSRNPMKWEKPLFVKDGKSVIPAVDESSFELPD